jgi:hypothetical protein
VAEFAPGDVVVLKSGSMRMLVESVEGETVNVLWANEGAIGRETLPLFALNKWEDRGPPRERDGDRAGPPRGRPGGFAGGDRPRFNGPRGDRDGGDRKPGGGKPFGGPRSDRPAKVGMDGKPKAKKFFRKDDA